MSMFALKVRARVRYWEDAEVNGIEDTGGTLIPLRDGDSWCPTIRMADGVILDWPAGVVASIHYKVCDGGDYWILDEAGHVVAERLDNYVPDEFLSPEDPDALGDYVILNVDGDGKIAGWEEFDERPRRLADLDDGWTRVEAPRSAPTAEETTVRLSGYSDGNHYLEVNGEHAGFEYNEQRVRIAIPGVGDIVASLAFGDEWETTITIPAGLAVTAEMLDHHGDYGEKGCWITHEQAVRAADEVSP